MARIYGIKKRMEQNKTDEKLIKEILGGGDLINAVSRMEKLLEPSLMADILDSCACGGGKEYIKKCEETGKRLAGMPLAEKIGQISSDTENIVLCGDNALKISWRNKDGERYRCACSAAVKNGVKVSDLAKADNADGRAMPLSYCICCAGAYRRHLQLQLGVSLRTKEILASPINSGGEKPCEFLLEVVE